MCKVELEFELILSFDYLQEFVVFTVFSWFQMIIVIIMIVITIMIPIMIMIIILVRWQNCILWPKKKRSCCRSKGVSNVEHCEKGGNDIEMTALAAAGSSFSNNQ